MIQEKDVTVHPSIEMLRRFQAYLEHEISNYGLKNIDILFAKIRCNSEKNNDDTKILVHCTSPSLFVCRRIYDTKATLLIWAIVTYFDAKVSVQYGNIDKAMHLSRLQYYRTVTRHIKINGA